MKVIVLGTYILTKYQKNLLKRIKIYFYNEGVEISFPQQIIFQGKQSELQ